MIASFISIFKAILVLLKYPIYFCLFVYAIFVFLVSIHVVIGLSRGRRFQKTDTKKPKKKSIFQKLFYDLPKIYADDMFNKNPDYFKPHGVVIFEGRQGEGKTISMFEYAMNLQESYPKCKTITNTNYQYQNDALTDWRQLIDYINDIYGIVVCIDELQNWFSSKDSKDFPPEMLAVVTQNRKNRRIILGTAQNFYLLAKAIRSQTTEVRRCKTFLRMSDNSS